MDPLGSDFADKPTTKARKLDRRSTLSLPLISRSSFVIGSILLLTYRQYERYPKYPSLEHLALMAA